MLCVKRTEVASGTAAPLTWAPSPSVHTRERSSDPVDKSSTQPGYSVPAAVGNHHTLSTYLSRLCFLTDFSLLIHFSLQPFIFIRARVISNVLNRITSPLLHLLKYPNNSLRVPAPPGLMSSTPYLLSCSNIGVLSDPLVSFLGPTADLSLNDIPKPDVCGTVVNPISLIICRPFALQVMADIVFMILGFFWLKTQLFVYVKFCLNPLRPDIITFSNK